MHQLMQYKVMSLSLPEEQYYRKKNTFDSFKAEFGEGTPGQ